MRQEEKEVSLDGRRSETTTLGQIQCLVLFAGAWSAKRAERDWRGGLPPLAAMFPTSKVDALGLALWQTEGYALDFGVTYLR